MFPAGLFGLTPRDIVGQAVEVITRQARVVTATSAIGFGITIPVFTVPVARLFYLSYASLHITLDPGMIPRTGHLQLLIPDQNFPAHISLGTIQPNGGFTFADFGANIGALIPPGTVISGGFGGLNGGAGLSLYEWTVYGYLFPIGNTNPRG